jgi:hypothetical protein
MRMRWNMATAKKTAKVDLMVSPDSDKESKMKALKTAIAQIEKKHGEGSVMRLGDNNRMEIQAVSKDESLEDIYKQVQILSILTGVAEEEILHLTIGEYKELVARSQFLNPENVPYKQVAKKYLVGDFQLIPVTDFRKLETCQYIDFQTYAPDIDKYLVEFLSVILVPKGHRYNE